MVDKANGMNLRASTAIALLALMPNAVWAGNIGGTVVIRRSLTRRTVTPAANAYQRGVAVPLGQDSGEDPLGFERTHVVIYLDEKGTPDVAVTAVMEQRGRRFLPDLLVVPTGSTVSFPNRDLIFHNVFSFSKPKTFDLGNYPKDHTRVVTFTKPGIVLLNCRLHPNMGAAIVVTPSQWATRADASGEFVLTNIPAGKHTVVAWHKAAGFFRQNVEVSETGNARVQFLIPFAAEDGASPAAAE